MELIKNENFVIAVGEDFVFQAFIDIERRRLRHIVDPNYQTLLRDLDNRYLAYDMQVFNATQQRHPYLPIFVDNLTDPSVIIHNYTTNPPFSNGTGGYFIKIDGPDDDTHVDDPVVFATTWQIGLDRTGSFYDVFDFSDLYNSLPATISRLQNRLRTVLIPYLEGLPY